MKRDKWKKLLGICFVIGALVFSFWYGGNAPGLQGFSVNDPVNEAALKERITEKDRTPEETQEKINAEEKKTDRNIDEEKDEVTEDRGKTTEKKKNGGEGFFEKIFMQVRNTGSSNKSKKLQTSKKASKNANKAAKKNNRKKTSDKKSGNDTANSSESKASKKSNKSTEGTSDKNDDEPASSASNNENTEDARTITCTISISCASVLNHLDKLTESTRKVIPEDGVILDRVSVDVKEGSTVFDVLKKAAKENNVQLEYNYTPAYKTYYIEGIGNLYEFDAGNLSGWMYSVNGTFPGVGCSGYKVKDGDIIQWHYTCNFGKDV